MATLDGVTRSTAIIVPAVQNQVVQHLEGGIAAEIDVSDGQRVVAGQPLVLIKDMQSQALLEQTRTQLQGKRATLARLDALLANDEQVVFPQDVTDTQLVANEQQLFAQMRKQQAEDKAAMNDLVNQKRLELQGLEARKASLLQRRELAQSRTSSLKTLYEMSAVSHNEYLVAQIALQEIDTDLKDLESAIPEKDAALSESQRRQTTSEMDTLSKMSQEKSEVLVDISKLEQALADLEDRQDRSIVRAPVDGTINKLFFQTPGSVISPGAPIAEIVPDSSGTVLEAKLTPADRAEIWPGSTAVVKVTAYDYSIYGGLHAEVTDISPDVLRDSEGQPYFRVRLKTTESFGSDHPVSPGMTANIDFLTKRYTILQYVLSPIINTADLALRQ